MAYLSLYRRWRSQKFSDVVGQQYIVQTLKNSLDTGRISHAYLFAGPRGTGKTTLARLFAKGLNCEKGPTSDFCGQCDECADITQGNSLNVMEIDGASNRGIDEIRELRDQVRYAPTNSRYKVYIIDEVHMLTTDAFNALLKTLEEPPEKVIFILATTDPQKIPPTILSRCQRYDFKRFSVAQITDHLEYVLAKEGVLPEAGVLEIVAEHAEGGMRDALGIVDQCLAYSDQLSVEVVTEVLGVSPRARIISFLEALEQKDGQKLFAQINQLYLDGKNMIQFVRDLLNFLRKAIINNNEFPGDRDRMLQVMEAFAECERNMRYVNDTNVPLELAVLKLIEPVSELDQLRSQINQIEARVNQSDKAKDSHHSQEPDTESTDSTTVKVVVTNNDQEKLQAIKANWYEYLQMLHNDRLVQPEAFLREGSPVAIKGKELLIAFPQGRGFHKTSIEQSRHREPAERALTKMFGCQLTIKCITDDDELQSEQLNDEAVSHVDNDENGNSNDKKEIDNDKSAEPKDDYDESVDAALRIFGGKVISVKKDKEGGD